MPMWLWVLPGVVGLIIEFVVISSTSANRQAEELRSLSQLAREAEKEKPRFPASVRGDFPSGTMSSDAPSGSRTSSSGATTER